MKCTIPLANVAAGAHTLSLTTWSGTNGTGSKLGANSSIAFTVVANQANTVSGVIGGIATAVNIVPISGATGSMTQGFTIVESTQPASFASNPVDAAGNTIVGPGAPTVSVSMDNASATATAGTVPNTFTIAASAGDTGPQVINLGHLRIQVNPAANSGGTFLSSQVGMYGAQPRVYVVGTNNVVASYDELGTLQANPAAADAINGTPASVALAWNPTSQLLISLTSTRVQAYNFAGDNIAANLAQGAVTPANGVIAWDDTDQLLFEFDTTSGKLATVGPWPNPTTITLLGASSLGSPYTALVWSGSTPGGGQLQDYLYGATSAGVFNVQTTGAHSALTAPSIGSITGLAYDSASGNLFVSGSTGVAEYSFDNLDASPGFAGVTGATGIAFNPANGLVYVAEGAANKIVAFNESGVQQFSFSTGALVPQQIIVVP